VKITGFAAVAVALSLFFNGDAKAAISTFPASVFQTGGTGSINATTCSRVGWFCTISVIWPAR